MVRSSMPPTKIVSPRAKPSCEGTSIFVAPHGKAPMAFVIMVSFLAFATADCNLCASLLGPPARVFASAAASRSCSSSDTNAHTAWSWALHRCAATSKPFCQTASSDPASLAASAAPSTASDPEPCWMCCSKCFSASFLNLPSSVTSFQERKQVRCDKLHASLRNLLAASSCFNRSSPSWSAAAGRPTCFPAAIALRKRGVSHSSMAFSSSC
mmetsp:Transcript_25743/g.59529  ORF Transcript_25743/g.59529 Transcript_25743/m.59529 type:complete len:212 (+) Transcript_25743:681-1316(+)